MFDTYLNQRKIAKLYYRRLTESLFLHVILSRLYYRERFT